MLPTRTELRAMCRDLGRIAQSLGEIAGVLLPWLPVFVLSALLVVGYPQWTIFNVHLASHIPAWWIGPVIVVLTRVWGKAFGK